MFSKISSLFSKTDHSYYLVVDIGTTGVKAVIFDEAGSQVARAYRLLQTIKPQPGWVEQDPMEMVAAAIFVMKAAVAEAKISVEKIFSCGFTNQRETTILWDKRTGLPVYPAIVWADERTEAECEALRAGQGDLVRQKTGLVLESYFSATKIKWILANVPSASAAAADGYLAFGTVDSWLLWNLCEDAPHLTDYTNASRTLLFNIKTMEWDEELLAIFKVPRNILPVVRPSASLFGHLRGDILGRVLPVKALIGDQESSAVAADMVRGVTKVTFGTGTFIMQGLGSDFRLCDGFYTTLVPGSAGPEYVLEGKVGAYGPAVSKYLNDPVELKPILDEVARATAAMLTRLPLPYSRLIIDGGISQSDYLFERLKDITKTEIVRQKVYDGTALGVWKILCV